MATEALAGPLEAQLQDRLTAATAEAQRVLGIDEESTGGRAEPRSRLD